MPRGIHERPPYPGEPRFRGDDRFRGYESRRMTERPYERDEQRRMGRRARDDERFTRSFDEDRFRGDEDARFGSERYEDQDRERARRERDEEDRFRPTGGYGGPYGRASYDRDEDRYGIFDRDEDYERDHFNIDEDDRAGRVWHTMGDRLERARMGRGRLERERFEPRFDRDRFDRDRLDRDRFDRDRFDRDRMYERSREYNLYNRARDEHRGWYDDRDFRDRDIREYREYDPRDPHSIYRLDEERRRGGGYEERRGEPYRPGRWRTGGGGDRNR